MLITIICAWVWLFGFAKVARTIEKRLLMQRMSVANYAEIFVLWPWLLLYYKGAR